MAITYSGVNAWVDESRIDFFMDAVASNDVIPYLKKYGLVITGVKADTIKLGKLSTTVVIADGSTCLTSPGTGNDSVIKQTQIDLKKGVISDKICVHDMEEYFTAQGLSAGQHYEGIGAFEAGILASIAEVSGAAIGNEMWNGGSNWITSGYVDQLLAANLGTGASGGVVGTTTPTAGGSAGTDAAGVYNICNALLNRAVANVNFASLVRSGRCHIVMSPQDFLFLCQNYTTLHGGNIMTPGLNQLQAGDFAEFNFPGTKVPVVVQNFLTGTGIIALIRNGNMAAAFDLESDLTSIRMGMDQYEEFMWWKLRFKGGVGFHDLTTKNILYWGPAS